ncbi:GntR family transcriptional regulator [Paenibacillus beijingensis]|uniref:HTH gntR-type domain-containing protein n=1 Tax=Paenibacillus beijingensis TaxID=1126833 RepID=A0A0D5NKF5_9BACL|nr:GntR family transcriptional regulator [Paenibacillus beijingensis]AJY75413.1 hypothetical protein VN24_13585 [Paenibacillus beijingensis]
MLEKLSQPESLADRAYLEIKQAIIQGKFMPGELLPEEAVASMLGISRTPIRKAVAKLHYEGLVELENGKVARVARITEKDLQHFMSLRQHLETFAAEQAVPYVTESFIHQLQQLMVAQKQAIADANWDQFIDIDFRFHQAIAVITENQKLAEFIGQINNNLHRYLTLSGTLSQSAHEAYEEHLVIIDSLQRRDAAKAKEAMFNHLQHVHFRSLLKTDASENATDKQDAKS